jgi:cation transport ATPase
VLWTLWRCARDLLRRRIETTTLLAAATATAIASRIALLAVLDATSIPVQFRYEIPAMVLVPALIGLMLADFLPRQRTR